ncbi:MAG: type VI secretion system-associated FHA domain protein TagH, partial [Pseudolabrys sp.]
IGRAIGNAITLPDPERHISRTHATVQYRGGQYVIRDLGSATPVYVNGKALGNGHEASINSGDEIRIGSYVMRVAAVDSTLTSAPPRAAAPPTDNPDPLAVMGGQASADPFADLLGPAAPPPQTPASGALRESRSPPPSSGPGSNGLIPEDFDPFADFSTPASSEAPIPEDPNLAFGPGPAEPKIDQLLDLDSAKQLDPLHIHQGSNESSPETGAGSSLDPLVALGAAPTAEPSGPPQRNDMSELDGAFRAPDMRPPAATPPSRGTPKTTPPAQGSDSPREPYGAMYSWEGADADGGGEKFSRRTVPSPKRTRPHPSGDAEGAGARRANTAGAAANAPGRSGAGSADMPARGQDTAAYSSNGQDKEVRDELLHAFLAGAGLDEAEIRGGLTPGMMTRVGQLLREATQGTLDLLLARALTKREVRADVTMIASRNNNPLKFSPNVDVALAQLLGPQERGFMSPVNAMKDAYDDLRSHQFGFMAGMRAALHGVLEQLNPERLEPRLKQHSMLDSLLPMNRKAKLWDLFSQYYQDIAEEAEEDFQALFGKEFLRAYQAQIATLEQEEKNKGQ